MKLIDWIKNLFQKQCSCGCEGLIVNEDADDVGDFGLTLSGRRVLKVWIAPGTVAGVSEADFKKRIAAAMKELSSFTSIDFVFSNTPSGSHTRIYPATDEMMKKKWRDPLGQNRVPLGLQSGNWIYLTTRDRWRGARVLEATVIHEMGHRFGLRYPENKSDSKHSPQRTDLMAWDQPVQTPSANDKKKFAERVK